MEKMGITEEQLEAMTEQHERSDDRCPTTAALSRAALCRSRPNCCGHHVGMNANGGRHRAGETGGESGSRMTSKKKENFHKIEA